MPLVKDIIEDVIAALLGHKQRSCCLNRGGSPCQTQHESVVGKLALCSCTNIYIIYATKQVGFSWTQKASAPAIYSCSNDGSPGTNCDWVVHGKRIQQSLHEPWTGRQIFGQSELSTVLQCIGDPRIPCPCPCLHLFGSAKVARQVKPYRLIEKLSFGPKQISIYRWLILRYVGTAYKKLACPHRQPVPQRHVRGPEADVIPTRLIRRAQGTVPSR